jgi:hypothetical protein
MRAAKLPIKLQRVKVKFEFICYELVICVAGFLLFAILLKTYIADKYRGVHKAYMGTLFNF